MLWEPNNNAANFYYYAGQLLDFVEKQEIAANSTILNIRDSDDRDGLSVSYVCIDLDMNTESYKYLYFTISSGSYYILNSTIQSTHPFYIYNKEGALIESTIVSYKAENWVLSNFSNFERIQINNAFLANGFCFSASSNISYYAPENSDAVINSYAFEVSKIWLSNK